jgi:hypothetical protein
MAELQAKLARCQSLRKTLRLKDLPTALNRRQVDTIGREIDDLMESLERIDEVKVEEQEQLGIKLIPELPFKDFSDTKLQRIITRSERRSEEIAKQSCPVIAGIVAQMCEELEYQPRAGSRIPPHRERLKQPTSAATAGT